MTVVGDDDQSIYRFRGAAISNILEFRERYRGARTVVLRRNYRSLAPILDSAHRLIQFNDPDRLEVKVGISKRLVPERVNRAAPPVRHHAFATSGEEADWIAAEVRRRVDGGARPRDHAVLVRANADADPVLRSLNGAGLPWRFSGTSGLYARPEVRLLLSLLRAVADPGSSVDVYALAASDRFAIPSGRPRPSWRRPARRRHRSVFEVARGARDAAGLSPPLARGSSRARAPHRGPAALPRPGPAPPRRRGPLRLPSRQRLARRAGGATSVAAEEQLANIGRFFDIVPDAVGAPRGRSRGLPRPTPRDPDRGGRRPRHRRSGSGRRRRPRDDRPQGEGARVPGRVPARPGRGSVPGAVAARAAGDAARARRRDPARRATGTSRRSGACSTSR